MRKLTVFTIALALVLTLAGCGPADTPAPSTAAPTTAPTTVPTEPPITVEQVYASVQAAMAEAEASRMYMDLSFTLDYTEGEGDSAVTTQISYAFTVDTMVSTDPFGSYNNMTIAMESEDFSLDYDVDIYTVEEDGSVVAYIQMFGLWVRSDYEMSLKEFMASGQMTEITTSEVWAGGEMPADTTLDESTTMLGGTEVYILRTIIPAEGMADVFSGMGVEITEDLDTITLPVTYYVDAENFTIVRVETGMQPLMDIVGEALLSSMLEDTEGVEFSLQIPNAAYDLGYGPQEIPAVPQEAYDYIANEATAPEETEPEDTQWEETGDTGPFVLNCGEDAMLITCPEGFVGEVYSDVNIWIYDEEFSLVGDYYYCEGWTGEDVVSYFIQFDIDSMTQAESYISHGDGPAMEGYTTMVVIGDGVSYYYAWTEAGDGLFLAYLYDYTGANDPAAVMQQLLDCVTPYGE